MTDIYQMIETQHCPNCEATEQKLHDFRQEVSDAVEEYAADQPYIWKGNASVYFQRFIIPKPKPDPLVEALEGVTFDHYPPNDAKTIRAALEARGLEIREKGQ
jgi:hypothetical protein